MRWHDLHNRLMIGAADTNRLTTSQCAALSTLLSAIEAGEPRINLFGEAGVGKTFLSHAICKRLNGTYLSHCESTRGLGQVTGLVVVDNAPPARTAARDVFGDLFWRGAQTTILVTRRAIRDVVCRVPLALTETDVGYVIEAAARVVGSPISTFPLQMRPSLWVLVAAFAMKD